VLAGLILDRIADSLVALLRWSRVEIGLPGLTGVTPPERVTQEVKTFARYTADAGLVVVNLQLQFLDYLSHRLHGDVGRTLAADHQVVGVVDDDGFQPLLRT